MIISPSPGRSLSHRDKSSVVRITKSPPCKKSPHTEQTSSIGVTYGGYGGYAYPRGVRVPPTFWSGGYGTPTFWAYDRKNNSDFPSSSAHVSPYNIQENVWRLGLSSRNRVHRRSIGLGPKGVEKLHNHFCCANGANIYVKVLCLVIVNVNVTKYVPQKCQI